MYNEQLNKAIENALSQLNRIEESILRYILSSSLAGAYIGIAVVSSMIIGGYLQSTPYVTLVMGASFGIALTLIIFAGADLFTGNNMFFSISTLAGKTTFRETLKIWVWCYLGNFLGAFGFCLLIVGTGIFTDISLDHILVKIAEKKMNLDVSELFFRGLLCNWIVCLAIWMTYRVKSDTAKMMVIYMCLFTFIVSGFEHVVANMTILTLSLLLPHPDTISLIGLFRNLVPVTFGNIVGGSVFVGGVYFYITKINKEEKKSKVIGHTFSHIEKSETGLFEEKASM